MDQEVSQKFFKQTNQLPNDEKINNLYNCQLDGKVNCNGKLYVGTQAIYFYSKVNYKTVVGKSTKIRLQFRDIRCFNTVGASSISIKLEVMRQVGQDLRSTGNSKYTVPIEYTFKGFKFDQLTQCLDELIKAKDSVRI